jgi:pullulanase/glycogen debranching enzyme
MGCYGPGGDSISASLAFKELVKELHRNGIEVLEVLDLPQIFTRCVFSG